MFAARSWSSIAIVALLLSLRVDESYGEVEWSVRLRGGATPLDGRVEVFVEGEWGGVRGDDEWGMEEAAVVCRQLGFLMARATTQGGHSSSVHSPVHIGHVQCEGGERSLRDCEHMEITRHHMMHHVQHARVMCAVEHSLRLSNVSSQTEGQLEVLDGDGVWRGVCSDNWTREEAEVACRQLGFEQLVEFEGVPEVAIPSQIVSLPTLNCSGNEFHVRTCPGFSVSHDKCSSQQSVYLQCAGAPLTPHRPVIENASCKSLRLSWSPPNDQGHPIINHTLRYRPLNHTDLIEWTLMNINESNPEGERIEVILEHLSSATHYQVEISATNQIGGSPFSKSTIAATTQPEGLLPPDNLGVVHVGSDNATLSWNYNSTAKSCRVSPTSYELIYRPLDSAHTDSVVQINASTTNGGDAVTLDELRPFTSYSVQIRGVGYDGRGHMTTSRRSEAVTFRTLESVPTAPPQTFTVFLSHLDVSAHFQWSPAPSSHINGQLTGYSLLCRRGQEGRIIRHETLPGDTLQYMLQTLDNGTEYNCSIAAQTQAGEGPRSAPVYFTTPGDLNQRPGPPRNVAFAIQSSDNDKTFHVHASWQAHDCDDDYNCIQTLGYVISCEYERRRGMKEDIRMTVWQADIQNTLIFPSATAAMKAEPFTSYSCRIASMNEYGVGLYGSRVAVEQAETVPSLSPNVLYATHVQPDSVMLHWSYNEQPHSQYIVGFQIRVYNQDPRYPERNGAKFQEEVYTIQRVEDYEYSRILMYLAAGSNYNVEIAALTSRGEGPHARMSVSTLRTEPSYAPETLSSTITVDTEPFQFWFSWTLPRPTPPTLTHAGFVVHCYDNTSLLQSSTTDVLTHAVFTDDSQELYSTVATMPSNCDSSVRSYLCSVAAFNERGEGPRSDEIIIFLQCPPSGDIFSGTFLTQPYYSLAFLSTLILLIVTVIFAIIILCICNKCSWSFDREKSEPKYSSVYEDNYVDMRRAPSTSDTKSIWSRTAQPRPGISLPVAGESSDDPYNHYDEIPGDRNSRPENLYDEIHPRSCTTVFGGTGSTEMMQATQGSMGQESFLTLELSKCDPCSSECLAESQVTTTTLTTQGGSRLAHDTPLEIDLIRPTSASPVLSTEYVEMLQTPGIRVIANLGGSSEDKDLNSPSEDTRLDCPTLSLQRQEAESNPYYNVPELQRQEEEEEEMRKMAKLAESDSFDIDMPYFKETGSLSCNDEDITVAPCAENVDYREVGGVNMRPRPSVASGGSSRVASSCDEQSTADTANSN